MIPEIKPFRIAYKDDNGNLVVIVPAEQAGMSVEEIAKQVVPKGKKYKLIAESEIPKDRQFRAAWKIHGDKLVHDMDIAREIHMDRIRSMRTETFKKLDLEFTRALESGDMDKVKEFGQKRQKLRDIPQTFDLTGAENVQQLKSLIPSELQD